MPSTEIKTLTVGGNTYSFNDTTARAEIGTLNTAVSQKIDSDDVAAVGTSGNYNDLTNRPTQLSQFTDNLGNNPTHTHNNKQDKLVSGSNIKTINGNSILGSGNIEIEVPEPPTPSINHNVSTLDCGTLNNNTQSFIFPESQSVYAVAEIARPVNFQINAQNAAPNYILIQNTSLDDIDITFSNATANVNTIIIPVDGVVIPAEKFMEIGIIKVLNKLIITSSQILTY